MAHISSESRNPLRYCVFKICVSHARFVSQILCLCGLLSVMCSSSLLAQLAPNSVPLDSALILQPFWMLLLPSLSLENLPILPGGEPASLFQPAPWNRFSRILKSFLRWLVLRIRRAVQPSFWGHDWYIRGSFHSSRCAGEAVKVASSQKDVNWADLDLNHCAHYHIPLWILVLFRFVAHPIPRAKGK